MGTWNINEKNLGTKYAYVIAKTNQEEEEDNEYSEWFWDSFWEKLKDNQIKNNSILYSKPVKKYGVEICFLFEVAEEFGYYENAYFKIKESRINIDDLDEWLFEDLEFGIKQCYQNNRYFNEFTSQKRALQILKSIEKLKKEVEYELNRLVHYLSSYPAETGGWCTGKTYFIDHYPKRYKYKHFNFSEDEEMV